MERDSFVFYRSFYEAISDLDDSDRLACYEALMAYAMDGKEPEGKGIVTAMFKSFKPQVDANNRRYSNGCRGGKPKDNQEQTKPEPKSNQSVTKPEPSTNQEQTKPEPNENVNDNVNVNVNENDNENVNENVNEKKSGDKPHRAFVPPAVEEVAEYCTERQNGIDAQAFIDFYASKGWMIGKNKMKDWKAAVRTWEQRSRDNPQRNKRSVDDFFADIMGGD